MARFLSFDSGIVCAVVNVAEWPLKEQVIDRCLNLQQGCTVLTDKLDVLARCDYEGRYTPAN